MDWIASIVSLIPVVLGLGYWRYQMIWKRRYEVAEQAVIAAGEAVSGITYIRRSEDTEPGEIRQDPYLLVQRRLEEHEQAFRDLERATKSIAMHFSEVAATPFAELVSIHDELCLAQLNLYRRSRAEKLYANDEKEKLWGEWKATIFQRGADDLMATRVATAYDTVRYNFDPVLRPNFWMIFVPFALDSVVNGSRTPWRKLLDLISTRRPR